MIAKTKMRFRISAILKLIPIFMIFIGIMAFSGCTEKSQEPLSKNYTSSLGIEFVLIPPGEFEMGTPSYSGKLFDFDSPVHNVTFEKPFYMSKYEVTQKEWVEVMGYNPSSFIGEDLPVDSVLRSEVEKFIVKLNLKESSTKYRLPTEAEWEYACHAGTTTRFSFGDENLDLPNYGWSGYDSNETSHPVGLKAPNPWGLYDMHGNVWEMTLDTWHDSYEGAPSDGSAWIDENSSYFVGRGGSWNDGPNLCTSNFRGSNSVDTKLNCLGFRLVKEL